MVASVKSYILWIAEFWKIVFILGIALSTTLQQSKVRSQVVEKHVSLLHKLLSIVPNGAEWSLVGRNRKLWTVAYRAAAAKRTPSTAIRTRMSTTLRMNARDPSTNKTKYATDYGSTVRGTTPYIFIKISWKQAGVRIEVTADLEREISSTSVYFIVTAQITHFHSIVTTKEICCTNTFSKCCKL
jgi:hypothetical protein